MTMTLTEFLMARIAEDEATAKAASPGPWRALTSGISGGDHWYVCDSDESIALIHANDGSDEAQREPDAAHIARWDPSRVLAECEAKRRIMEWAEGPYKDPLDAVRYQALRLLALPYADHPDYLLEWKP